MSDIKLPSFKEGSFRGAFGKIFRRLVCASPRQEKCQACLLFKKCAFSVIFSPGAVQGDEYLKNFESIPRPFTIHILNHNSCISAGEELLVKMTLIGKAKEYFPYIFLTIQELGREGFGIIKDNGERGKYEIAFVEECFPGGNSEKHSVIIYREESPQKGRSVQGFSLQEIIEERDVTSCTVVLDSPLRLRREGKLVQFVDFRWLLRTIITRLNALSYFYGKGSIMQDYQVLLQEAEKTNVSSCNTRFMDYQWHSGRQKVNIRLGGLVGEITYRGKISPFYPYLQAAEIIGVGKNTTFGFGRIKLK